MQTVLPSRQEFLELFRSGKRVPVAACLELEADPVSLFEAVAWESPHVLLESARRHPVTGRYSLMVGEPSALLMAKGDRVRWQDPQGTREFRGDPLTLLRQHLAANRALRGSGFPPFVGGAVGFIGFDAYRLWRSCASYAVDDLPLPDIGFLFCDQALVLDHLEGKLWVIALAGSDRQAGRAYDQAVAQVEALVGRATRSGEQNLKDRGEQGLARMSKGIPSFPPAHPCSPLLTPGIFSTHTRAEFEKMVRSAKGFIADGDIYQANLSQRLTVSLADSPWAMYRRLRAVNPSPFAAFADFPLEGFGEGGGLQIVSASPERLVRLEADTLETRPLAGTRPKGVTAVETARLRQELILNEKERAEHLMLVDLGRNDLGRVCRYGSVRVDEWMALEEYSHVIHIVSNVMGQLAAGRVATDVVKALFPGGTISGCPKIRCLEIIDALEPVRRQLYTGSLGYLSYSGEMDLNLLIRTALIHRGRVNIQAGAGIVADSDPAREYEETLYKAQALKEVFDAGIHPVEEGSRGVLHSVSR